MNFVGLPPYFDLALIILLYLTAIISFALYRSPRVNGGDHINAARLIKAFGYLILGGWYTYRFVDLGDVRISTIAAIAILLISFGDFFAGISKLGAVAKPRQPRHRDNAAHNGA